MNCVERVKKVCKERKIPLYKLEKELGFANGYIGQLKKGTMPAERLSKISDYLGVSQSFLLYGEGKKPVLTDEDELGRMSDWKYYELNEENRALVDQMIEKLLKSQSDE